MKEQGPRYRFVSADGFYPVPSQRIEDPLPAAFDAGDLVRARIGPASGRIGVVVVERNGNFKDWEPYAATDSIGVRFAERQEFDPMLQGVVEELIDHEATVTTIVRWFDKPEQLELEQKLKKNDPNK